MRTWKIENLIEAVKVSKSYAEVLRKLNLKPAGGNYIQLKKYIKETYFLWNLIILLHLFLSYSISYFLHH